MNCAADLLREPTLAQALLNAIAALGLKIHTSAVASVISYDPTTQLADLQVQVRHPRLNDDNSVSFDQVPVMPEVPVEFPGAGPLRITWALQPGDTGVVEFTEHPLEQWLVSGGIVSPASLQRFEWGHGIFRPGVKDNSRPFQSAATRGMNLGHDAGPQVVLTGTTVELGGNDGSPPADFVALASKVLTQLQAMVNAFNTHVHVVPGVTSGPSSTNSNVPTVPAANPASVASSIIKAE